jgi:hypothetical protein
VNQARRTLGCWLLAAFLERGCDPTTRRLPQPVRRERSLTAAELRVLLGPPASVHFLPRPRLRDVAGAAAEPAAATARLLAFPAR